MVSGLPVLPGKDSIFMGNIDEKRLSALLERIGKIKVELEALENEVRGLGTISGSAEESVKPEESPKTAFDETPIDIAIQDIDISPVIEDPAVEYAASPMVAELAEVTAEPAGQEIPATEPVEVAAEPAGQETPATEPVEVAAEPAGQETPVAGPDEVAVGPDATADPTTVDDLPFDDDLPLEAEPEPIPEPAEEPALEPMLDIEPELVTKSTPEPAPKSKVSILDSQKAETAVMDVMAEKQAWRTDRPGSQVKNVISAISLNDRVLLINVLFKEDPILFQNTISAFNNMTSLDEAIAYINANFPDWDLNSEPVYRLMMAVRRKLR